VPDPIRRTTARVVPVNREGEVLLLRVDDVTVTFDGLEPLEVGNVLDSGWFAPDAIPIELAGSDLPEVARLAVAAVAAVRP
jgi:hypothetical protein